MKAVILAAGKGTRLRPLTERLPKSLIEVGGKTLLERSLDNLKEAGITEAVIVVGFFAERIKEKLGRVYNGISIDYIQNDDYPTSGSMWSFYKSKDIIGDDGVILLESDILYEVKALKSLLQAEEKDLILTAEPLNSGDDVYTSSDEQRRLVDLGKTISKENQKGPESVLVGISKYSNEFLAKLFAKAEEDYYKGEQMYHYEETVFATSQLGYPVHTLFCSGLKWTEIDNKADLKKSREEVYPRLKERISCGEAKAIFPKVKRNILLNPGPATTTDTVKYAQVVPDICPREKEFGGLMGTICKDLTKIAGGDEDYACVLFGGSGTAAMDSVINSVVPPGKKVLIVNNGAYGERLVKIARAYGVSAVEVSCEWDKLPDVQKIEAMLAEDSEIACVAIVHHETTTGLLNPVEKIGKIVKKQGKVFIVDTISSFAGVPLNVKDFNIDFMMSTSNKCIQGMAGVCFVVCKKEELERIKNYPRRSFYLSLYDQYEYFREKSQMRFTPPVQTLYALRRAIDEFLEEGYENRVSRYANNWKTLREGVEKLGLKVLTNPEEESKLLITVLYPDSTFDFNKLHDQLYEKGFTIYPGKVGKIDSFRLANMGEINKEDINNFLVCLKEVLVEMSVLS